MSEWEAVLSVSGRAVITVIADSEAEAVAKAEQYDPWDLDVDITYTSCDSVVSVSDDD